MANTRNVYWVALALVVVVYVVARVAVSSPTGRVWQAIRENEQRVEVLGLNPTAYKLVVFVLVMVVLGGAGRLWGALLGGMIYTCLDHRVGELSTTTGVQDLPRSSGSRWPSRCSSSVPCSW